MLPLALVAALLAISTSALSFEAKYRGEYQVFSSNSEDDSSPHTLYLEHNKVIDKLNALFSLRLDHDINPDHLNWYDIDAQELYISYQYSEPLLLTVGRKVESWGKTDEFNPSDFLSPQDLRYFLLREKGERLLGNNLVKLNYQNNYANLSLYYIPIQRKSYLPDHNSPWAGYELNKLHNTLGLQVESQDNLNTKPQFAVKLDKDTGDWAVEFVLFHGYHQLPEYNKELTGVGVIAQETYKKYNGIGLSFSRAFKDFTTRLEAGYQDQYQFFTEGISPTVQSPTVQGVAAVDYDSPWGIYFNLQYAYSQITNYRPSIIQDEESDFLMLQASYKALEDKLETKLKVAHHAKSKAGSFYNPSIEYAAFDFGTITFGTQFYYGKNERGLFSQYSNNNNYYLQLNMNY